jgi:hypothetical protein
VENSELAVDRDAGVEVWIFFNGDEEGTDGEDGSTCANVRFGIRQCLLKGVGVALHWQ